MNRTALASRSCGRALAIVAGGLLALLASPGVGWAQPAPDNAANKRAAESAMREGNTLLGRGKHAEALAAFDEANRLYPSARLQFNRAQALQGLPGREVETLEALLRFLDEAREPPAALRAAADKEVRRLRRELALVRVDVEPPGATIIIDGREVATAPMTRSHVVRPGPLRLEVRKAGHAPFGPEPLTLVAGQELRRQVLLRAAEPPPSLALPVPSATPPTGATPPPPLPSVVNGQVAATDVHAQGAADAPAIYRRGWFWVATGAAVAAGVVATVLIVRSGHGAKSYQCPTTTAMIPCQTLP